MPVAVRSLAPIALCAALLLSACDMLRPAATTAPAASAAPVKAPAARPPAAAGIGAGPAIVLSSAQAAPGQRATITATLRSGGASIAGAQNDIGFDPQVAIAAKGNGKPDCSPNPSIGKEGTAFSFQPARCTPGAGCTGVRALVLSLSNVEPIANGSVLYTCTVQVAAQASAGAHALTLSRAGFSSPQGEAIDGGGSNGSVTVGK